MYLIIPLSIFIVSLVGIAVIVWRKLPYLRKLTPEGNTGDTFWSNFAPELISFYDRLNVAGYRNRLLLETEKFLRRIRLVFLRIDSLSDVLIKKIRRSHKIQEIAEVPVEKTVETPIVTGIRTKKTKAVIAEELKLKEQKLIIEIAKSPKNPSLYVKLGDIYTKLNQIDDAREAFEAALKLNSEDKEVMERLRKISKSPSPEVN